MFDDIDINVFTCMWLRTTDMPCYLGPRRIVRVIFLVNISTFKDFVQ